MYHLHHTAEQKQLDTVFHGCDVT